MGIFKLDNNNCETEMLAITRAISWIFYNTSTYICLINKRLKHHLLKTILSFLKLLSK